MKRLLRPMMYVACGLALLVLALYCVARLRGPTAAQREALALMERRPPPPGPNAFAAIWLLGYDMPEAELPRVVAQDLGRYPTRARTTSEGIPKTFESVAAERYAASILSDEDHRTLCMGARPNRSQGPDCVGAIVADPAPQRVLVGRHSALIERYRRLGRYTHARSPFPPEEWLWPKPTFITVAALARAQDVLAFLDGDADRALQGLCESTRMNRTLLRNPGSLVDSLIHIKALQGLSDDMGQLLARLPRDHRLPKVCSEAFAVPGVDEVFACDAMRGEFASQRATMSDLDSMKESFAAHGFPPVLFRAAFDPESALGQVAREFAATCSPAAREQVARDVPVRYLRDGAPSPLSLECLGNAAGCWGLRFTDYDLAPYQFVMQDHGARMRLVAAALHLRNQPGDGRELAARLASLPVSLSSPARPLEIVDGRVRMPLYRTEAGKQGGAFELPLATFLGRDG